MNFKKKSHRKKNSVDFFLKKKSQIFFEIFFSISNVQKKISKKNRKNQHFRIQNFRHFRFFFRKFENQKFSRFFSIFFRSEKMKILQWFFLKSISWSRRIILNRFRNNSNSLKMRKPWSKPSSVILIDVYTSIRTDLDGKYYSSMFQYFRTKCAFVVSSTMPPYPAGPN